MRYPPTEAADRVELAQERSYVCDRSNERDARVHQCPYVPSGPQLAEWNMIQSNLNACMVLLLYCYLFYLTLSSSSKRLVWSIGKCVENFQDDIFLPLLIHGRFSQHIDPSSFPAW